MVREAWKTLNVRRVVEDGAQACVDTEHHPNALLLIQIEPAASVHALRNTTESRGGDTKNAACLGRCRLPGANDP